MTTLPNTARSRFQIGDMVRLTTEAARHMRNGGPGGTGVVLKVRGPFLTGEFAYEVRWTGPGKRVVKLNPSDSQLQPAGSGKRRHPRATRSTSGTRLSRLAADVTRLVK